MIILTICFIFLVCVTPLNLFKEFKSYNVLILIFTGAVLITLPTFKYNVRDLGNYQDIFNLIPTLKNIERLDATYLRVEPAYLLLNILIKTLGLHFRFVLFTVAFLSITLSLYFFRKHTHYFLIATLVYFSHAYLLRDMIQIRAGLAASISLYSIQYIQKRKLLKFTLIIVLASLFHSGTLVLLLAYPIHIIQYKAKLIVLIASGFLLGLILTPDRIENIFTNILHIPAILIYVYDEEYFTVLGLLNPVLIKNLLLFIVIWIYRKELEKNITYFYPMLTLFAIGIFWLSAFNSFAIFAARIATFFSNTEHILFPSLFYTSINKLLLYIIMVIYCFYMFYAKYEIFPDLTFLTS